MLKKLELMSDPQARMSIQDIIDQQGLYASILYKGHRVWSRRRILQNLRRIIKRGQLYAGTNVKWMRMNSKVCLPAVEKDFKPILSEYFYEFLIHCCGSNPHYNRAGWIGIYPTLDRLKQFFLKNEHGKPVSEYIPEWKADVKRTVEDIEWLLYPFRSYMKARQKSH